MSARASDSTPPYVVLVLGPPASGKSTVSAEIAARWRLPLVAKDAIKETLFDTLGTGSVDWSMQLGRATFALLDHVIRLQLCTGESFVIDAAYTAEYENARYQQLQQEFGFTAVQVLCGASEDELARRFARRAADGSRHPGHRDAERVDDFFETLRGGRYDSLELRGPVLHHRSDEVESTEELLAALDRILPRPISARREN